MGGRILWTGLLQCSAVLSSLATSVCVPGVTGLVLDEERNFYALFLRTGRTRRDELSLPGSGLTSIITLAKKSFLWIPALEDASR